MADEVVNNVAKMSQTLGVNCNIGGKSVNQDTFFVHKAFAGDKRTALIAVLDGHGEKGEIMADYVREHIPIKLQEEIKKAGSSSNTAVSQLFPPSV